MLVYTGGVSISAVDNLFNSRVSGFWDMLDSISSISLCIDLNLISSLYSSEELELSELLDSSDPSDELDLSDLCRVSSLQSIW